jgi:hypothetical protein
VVEVYARRRGCPTWWRKTPKAGQKRRWVLRAKSGSAPRLAGKLGIWTLFKRQTVSVRQYLTFYAEWYHTDTVWITGEAGEAGIYSLLRMVWSPCTLATQLEATA